MIVRNIRVEDAERANDLTACIGQERIGNVVRFTKGVESLARIIGDRGGMNAMSTKCCQRHVQLDELIATIGSPIGATTKHEQ
jgi:hypothetical protein